jgi:outer membrane protein assembly factor BamB
MSLSRREFLAVASALPLAATPDTDWPAFRGPGGRGVADEFPTLTSWNLEAAKGVLWRAPVPGLGHSSPVVWGDRIFLPSSVSSSGTAPLKLGQTGEPTAADDNDDHLWVILCYDKRTGKKLWQQTAHQGAPRATRHVKATHANTSLATDGRSLAAFFGSEGLYCYDLEGRLRWSKDLGVINVSKYGIGWGFGSSPAIHENRVVVLCDDPERPFIAAFQLSDGKELWRVSRKDVCERSWGTPFIHTSGARSQVVTNGWPWIVSYELESGKELWRLHGGGDNPIPTPFAAHGWIFVTSAHGGQAPIYAVRPEASGDISGKTDSLVWSLPQGGSYISTPVIYGDHIYLGNTNGVLRCFESKTGRKIYEERLDPDASIYSSLVAADGKIYCGSEDGMVYVVKAGERFEILARNSVGDPCFATPALSRGVIYFRTAASLIAIG